MADTRIVIDGDSSGFVAAADRGAKAVDKIKDRTKTLGQEMDQTFKGIGKGILIVGALTKAFEAAGDAAIRMQAAAAKRSEERGGTAVTAGVALASTSLTDAQKQAVSGMIGSGATKAEDTAGFISALASQQGQRLQGGQAIELTRAFTSGAYTQSELLERAKRGQSITGQEINARLGSIGADAREELAIRSAQNLQRAEIAQASGDNPAARMVELEKERRRLENPIASGVLDTVQALPVINKLAVALEGFVIETQKSRQPLIGGQSPKE